MIVLEAVATIGAIFIVWLAYKVGRWIEKER
jgi:threonine/homoserine/homoserine lactone efflux protein